MHEGLSVFSEIGPLRRVMLHRPGDELLNLAPGNLSRLLFDDIPFLDVARREHDEFARVLREEGVEVDYLEDLVAEALEAVPDAQSELVDAYVGESGLGEGLLREAVRDRLMGEEDPRALVRLMASGVRADDVDVSHLSGATLADLTALLRAADEYLLVDPMPNLYFTRDSFSVIGRGVSLNSMRTRTRHREGLFGGFVFSHHPSYAGTPVWFSREETHSLEGGDVLVLSPDTVAVGVSERTDAAAVDALAKALLWREEAGFSRVIAVAIPARRAFMHLDTVMTQVDVDAFTVHPNVLDRVETYELVRGARVGEVTVRDLGPSLSSALAVGLGLPSVRLIRCGGDDPISAAREQWNDGSNTLAVRPGRLIVYQRNAVTNDILYKEGFDLLELSCAELSRGRGGPHCMSMAFRRDPLA